MKTDKELFEMANDIDFVIAIDDAKDKTPPMQREPFRTIGQRMDLIRELEKQGFTITKKK